MFTIDELKQALPVALKASATQAMVDQVNNLAIDPEAARTVRENLISYTSVLSQGRFKTSDYISAVTYVTFKLMGYTNQESYTRTFPVRYQALSARNVSSKDISAYVSAYNKGQLVNLVLEQTLIPTWILNQDTYQTAINTQLDLMLTAKSEKVRSDAANSILTHLKRPEKAQVELSVTTADAGVQAMRDMMLELATTQQELIAQGMHTKEIAHQRLVKAPTPEAIDGVMKDVTPAKPSDKPEKRL